MNHVKHNQRQASAWHELSECPSCRAGDEPVPGSDHERLWEVVTVAYITAHSRNKKAVMTETSAPDARR